MALPLRRGGTDFAYRLVVFPYAAAGPTAFRGLFARLPDPVQLLGVALPGRERRFDEPPGTTLAEVTAGVAGDLAARDPLPTVLLGHSLGAALAMAVASSAPAACEGLVISGRKPHGVPLGALHGLTDDEIAAFLAAAGNTAPELLADAYWRDHLIRLFRHDTALDVEATRQAGSGALRARILALGGTDDPYVDPAELSAWAARTSGSCTVAVFPGAHFFLLDPANHAAVGDALTGFLGVADHLRR
nr:alpha/beta fold hydrolase [Actinoplanes digitatis]